MSRQVLFGWYAARDGVEVVPEGAGFRSWQAFRDGFPTNEKRRLIVPRGTESVQRLIRHDDIPALLHDVLACTTEDAAVHNTEKWGPLREWPGAVDLWQRGAVLVDDVSAWLDLSFAVFCVSELHRSIIERSPQRHMAGKKQGAERGFHIARGAHSLSFAVHGAPGDTESLFARRALAQELQRGVDTARWRPEYHVIRTGEIRSLLVPCDLWSFVWKVVESFQPSVLDTPTATEYSLVRCEYCGVWDIANGHTDDAVPEPMRQNRYTGAWCHDRCRRNFDDERRRIARAEKEGREYRPRQGARVAGPSWLRERA